MNEITKYHWMSYSIIQNVVYCHPCWLFGDNATKQSIWVSGYSDWKHLTQSAIIHCNSKQHFRSDVALVQYSESKSIEAMISKQYSLEVKKWREILKLLFDVVLTISGLGLAFRGHRENINDARCGVYLSILKLIAKHNQVFEQHLQSSLRIKYTTDSTTDISHIDQMAIMIRFVEINKEQRTVKITERFLCFVPVKKGDANSLKDLIVNVLFKQRWNLLLEKSKSAESFKSLVNEDQNLYERELEDTNDIPLHTDSLCKTRWSARVKATEALLSNFQSVVECLEEESENSETNSESVFRARGLIKSLNWDHQNFQRFDENTRGISLTEEEKHRQIYFETLDNMIGELNERMNGFSKFKLGVPSVEFLVGGCSRFASSRGDVSLISV
ncbi:uncharacterized protein LOC112681293 [Sipha flava]|uniref:Uncharacterized protein LOC112681293 n=1 Tax=Sipha flava TaxID=143950 RepID=A0A8B8F988_9HEMI|nr:uncharacterized protein LOC112681293 [Sipha flava]